MLVPQAPQRQVQAPLGIDQQRAVPLALQQRAAVGRGQPEEIDLSLRVVSMQANALGHPAPQPLERHHANQFRRLAQERRQAGAGVRDVAAVNRDAGLAHQVYRQRQVLRHQFRRAQPSCHGRQALQQRHDGRAIGRFLEGLRRLDQRRKRGFAGQFSHRRPDLEKHQQRLDAAPELAQRARLREIGIEPARTQFSLCLVEAFIEDVVNGVEAAIEAVAQCLVAQGRTFGAHRRPASCRTSRRVWGAHSHRGSPGFTPPRRRWCCRASRGCRHRR